MVGQPPLQRALAARSLRGTTIIALGILLVLSFPLFGQQDYVTRYDVYGGYAFLNSGAVNLFENGFATQIGVRPKTWLSLGFDYTYGSGNLKIVPSQLLPALQTQLQQGIAAGIMAGLLPPNYPYSTLSVVGAFQDADLRRGSGTGLPALQGGDVFRASGLCGNHP